MFMLNSTENEMSTSHKNLNAEKTTCIAFKLSNVVFIMLIDKTFMSLIHFMLSLIVEHKKVL